MVMTRKEMLEYLDQVSFNVLWPDDSWDDLGFTESPIWIDNKGYGYYSCDEPNLYYKASCIPNDKWKQIRQKLAEGSLSLDDVKGTSLANMYFFEWLDEPGFCERFSSLLELPETLANDFYLAEVCADEVGTFATVEEMAAAIHEVHDNYFKKWKELSDDMLGVWVERIRKGIYGEGFDFYEVV